jgi:hypothetical protein
MKLMTLATSLVLTCWIAEPGAQRTPEPTNQPAHNVFLLTGCLERGTAPTAFRLTGASPVGQAPPRPTTSAASAETEGVYELQAASSVSELGLSSEKLLPEAGTRVQVTIRPIEATSPAPSPTRPAGGAEKPAESPRQRYTVITLERLADSCK